MMVYKKIFGILVITLMVFACKNETQPEIRTIEVGSAPVTAKKVLDPNAVFVKSEFTIDGMMCEIGCAKTIEKKLARMDGVKSATVDFERKLAMVEYDKSMVNHNNLEETVTKVADIYEVSDMKTVEAFSDK
jgi:Cu+-exporting ATPase